MINFIAYVDTLAWITYYEFVNHCLTSLCLLNGSAFSDNKLVFVVVLSMDLVYMLSLPIVLHGYFFYLMACTCLVLNYCGPSFYILEMNNKGLISLGLSNICLIMS